MISFLLIFSFSQIETEKTNLAEYYLAHLDLVSTPEKRNKAILKCLTEIALIIDAEASKKKVKSVIEEKFNPLTNLIDSKDRDMKTKFKDLQNEANNLEKEITKIINETESSLHQSLKNIRKEIIDSFNEIVKYSQIVNDNNINQIVDNIDESIEKQKNFSLQNSIAFFILLQIILGLAIFLSYRYIQNLKI
ncbi:hypothetical protein M9Y10_021547 [Tritrichomonas musculus]|uniref:Uncharacterized protein n=1 Tax=Tritrichomonas musculus TaxID=1915356 RepID=A0ABR2KRU7_9EUKA